MTKIVHVPQDDYRVKVQNTGTITLDTGPDIGSIDVLGLISVAGVTDYETLVTLDDHIPNKRYVVDTVNQAIIDAILSPADRSNLTDGTSTLYVHQNLGTDADLTLRLNGNLMAKWTQTEHTVQRFSISNSTISGTSIDTDITLTANGTGQVFIDDTVKIGGSPVIMRAGTVGANVNLFDTSTGTFDFANLGSTISIGSDLTTAQTIEIGAASTGASTYNFGTGPTLTSTTRTINIGTNGVVGSTTNVNIGGYGDSIIMLSPIGIRFKLTVSNDGLYNLTTLDSLVGLILTSPNSTRYGLNVTNGGDFQVVSMTPDPFSGATIKTTASTFEVTTYGGGLLIDSPNGTVYNHTFTDAGALVVASYSSETITNPYVIEVTTAGGGITMLSPSGIKYKLTVTNGGTASITIAAM